MVINLNDYELPVIACGFLFISMLNYWSSLIFSTPVVLSAGFSRVVNKIEIFPTIGKIGTFVSNFLFSLTLLFRWIHNGYFPLSNLYESLIFLSWAISLLHLLLEWKTKSRLIGSISTPILFLISAFSSLSLPTDMQKALPLVPSLQSNWLMMHVSMMMISYATLILGSLLGILYLSFLISRNRSSSLLEVLDLWSYRIIGLGFPFLTIGIISGAVWANEAWGSYWSWDPKETWALITWLVFASYLHSRLLRGWQGKKAALIASAGFFVIWICYLGVNFLGKGLHSYGWILS